MATLPARPPPHHHHHPAVRTLLLALAPSPSVLHLSTTSWCCDALRQLESAGEGRDEAGSSEQGVGKGKNTSSPFSPCSPPSQGRRCHEADWAAASGVEGCKAGM